MATINHHLQPARPVTTTGKFVISQCLSLWLPRTRWVGVCVCACVRVCVCSVMWYSIPRCQGCNKWKKRSPQVLKVCLSATMPSISKCAVWTVETFQLRLPVSRLHYGNGSRSPPQFVLRTSSVAAYWTLPMRHWIHFWLRFHCWRPQHVCGTETERSANRCKIISIFAYSTVQFNVKVKH